ncbi:MAG: tetratricopeptide repeat protein [Candidatus Sumerlaeia bacterium]|nr:tetratricopeptide repeat protein [Candidatus Sumerlaeia bacterium]
MRCPNCQTINRDDRPNCYHCGKDLVMLRLIINKAKQHYNNAVEKVAQEHHYEALGELDAALELDSRLVDAHVLRGTILARMERLDEAREAWERAISLDPQIGRAYKYVGQVAEVSGGAPVVRRARRAILASAAIILVCILGTGGVLAALRDPEAKTWQAAFAALDEGDLIRARDLAREMKSTERREAVEVALRGEMNGRLAEATRLARAGDEEGAIRRLRDLASLPISPEMNLAVEGEINALRDVYLQRHREWRAQERIDLATVGRTHAINREIRRLFPANAPDADFAWERFSSALRDQVAGDVSPVLTLLENSANAPTIESRLHIYTEFLDSEDPVVMEILTQTPLGTVHDRWRNSLVDWAREAAREGDRSQWSRHVTRLESWGDADSLQQARDSVALLEEHEADEARMQLDAALASGDNAAIIAAGERAESLGLPIAATQDRQVRRAREAVAVEAYYRLMEMADRIERLDLEESEAREVLRLVRHADGPLPPRIRTRAGENIRFFAIQAARILDDGEVASREYRNLQAAHGSSPYLLLLDQQEYTPNG